MDRYVRRALRPAPALRGSGRQKAKLAPPRLRRGVQGRLPDSWRRLAAPTNRISRLGMWQSGSRREAVRMNRVGATDWHRPFRARVAA